MNVNSHHLHKLFENQVKISPHNPAVIYENEQISYLQLDQRANLLTAWLRRQEIGPGKYVAILVERNDFAYVAMLAILKAGAAYVPLDPEYPTDRINYILSDCNVSLLITTTSLHQQHSAFPCAHFAFDQEFDQLMNTEVATTSAEQVNLSPEDTCYVIYTSGTTGRPKGVEITHRSVCNYVQEAKRIYEIDHKDRIYQGFSIAFDASIEEIWPTLTAGATLISTNNKALRAGANLIEFLNNHQVSCLSTVPTLLHMLEPPIPSLRLLVLGGEVCHQDLVVRWSRPRLRIVNTYGPTEATVVTTYCECHPDKPVTIGRPLSNYEVYVLNADMQPAGLNEAGELCIGGVCLSRGYVNRPDLNQAKFFTHAGLGNKRLYRTGDLCRTLESGEIQFVGRLDDQVKLRGFRIELAEIEAVIMEHTGIRQAVVSLWEQSPGVEFLVAYLIAENAENFASEDLLEFLKPRLAGYMLPSFFEIIDKFPLMPSGKIDRKSLPPPRSNTKPATKNHQPPHTEAEKKIVAVWQKLFNQDLISIAADFFYDLGGHSLLAAKAASLLREYPEFQRVSVMDIYKHSTIEKLAIKLTVDINQNTATVDADTPKNKKISSLQYYLSSCAQLIGAGIQFSIVSWEVLMVILLVTYFTHIYSYYSWQGISALVGLILVFPLILMALTIGVKWLLLGRVKPGSYRLWGTYYLRWWFVQRMQRTIINFSPLAGSPLLNLYCRLMGAKIGKNCHIGTQHLGIFDMLTIGDNSSINQEAALNGYIVKNGMLNIGPITIGERCFVGTRSVLSINTKVEDDGMLEDLSMLPENTIISKGQHYRGSPANPIEPQQSVSVDKTEINAVSLWKNIAYGCWHYLGLLLVGAIYAMAFAPGVALLGYFYEHSNLFYTIVIAAPLASLLFIIMLCLSIVIAKKILMNKVIQGSYPLRSGFYLRKWIVDHLLNLPEIEVFAESLYFPPLLRLLGMKIGKHVEIAELPHVTPELVTIHDEGFTASSVIASAPRIYLGRVFFAPTEIGKRTFVGSSAVLPPGTQLGERCLLGSLTIAPSETTPNRAWLGSPPLFLPRRQISQAFSEQETFNPPKSLYILRATVEFFRIILPTTFYFLILLGFFISYDFLRTNYSLPMVFLLFPICEITILCVMASLAIALKWIIIGKYRPGMRPLWHIFIWKRDCLEHLHNLFLGKMVFEFLLGTPFLSFLHRLLGAKIGKRVFIDTRIGFAEHDLIDIGDNVTLNSACVLLTHLYEDRIFKMDKLKIGNGCSIGTFSIVAYDTIMEKNASLDNLSLLMKGERLPANSQWVGIPSQSCNPIPTLEDKLLSQAPRQNPPKRHCYQ